MKTLFKKLLKYVWRGLLFFVGFVAIYLLATVAGALITTGGVPAKAVNSGSKITIYVVTNGVHTDLVLPVKHTIKNWRTHLKNTRQQSHLQAAYIGFGWGDRDFFLKSVNAPPNIATTLKATFLPSQSLMHLSFYPNIAPHLPHVYPLNISTLQYKALVSYILKSFKMSPQQQFQWVASGYQSYDAFFEAKGRYHLFNTCNNWTNRGLKTLGINTGIWTPFEQGVLYHLKK